MAAFIAIKPCRFGSTDYGEGDIIPDGVVLPARVRAMTRMGYIAPATLPTQETGQDVQESSQEPPKPKEDGQESPPQGQESGEDASAEKKPAAKNAKK